MKTQHDSLDAQILKWGAIGALVLAVAAFVGSAVAPQSMASARDRQQTTSSLTAGS